MAYNAVATTLDGQPLSVRDLAIEEETLRIMKRQRTRIAGRRTLLATLVVSAATLTITMLPVASVAG